MNRRGSGPQLDRTTAIRQQPQILPFTAFPRERTDIKAGGAL
ncbi:hypothetical protein FM113_11270 [Leucobacter sp. 7(1)]|nr:hypothetical protein FM113_11270 [Leucobacter sp. 7(1)]